MNDRDVLIALNLTQGVGPRSIAKVLERIERPSQLVGMNAGAVAECARIRRDLAQRVVDGLREADVAAEIEKASTGGATILTRCDDDYPQPLRRISDPPMVLYVKGEYQPTDAIALAMVGARRATHFGTAAAAKLAGQLATLGFTVVSGLARGIDAAAHRGALQVGGRTLAVCGSGLATVYPREHRKLADKICRSGAVLTEFPMTFPVMAENFPRRNRIISGSCLGVIVVEAAKRSGSLITARVATEQGREVFAMPGRAGSPTSRGAHQLIKDGAKLVDDIEDIIEEFPEVATQLLRVDDDAAPARGLGDLERQVLDRLDHDPIDPETLAGNTDRSIPEVLGALSTLELLRLAAPVPGGRWTKNQ